MNIMIILRENICTSIDKVLDCEVFVEGYIIRSLGKVEDYQFLQTTYCITSNYCVWITCLFSSTVWRIR